MVICFEPVLLIFGDGLINSMHLPLFPNCCFDTQFAHLYVQIFIQLPYLGDRGIGQKIPEGHANLQQILQQKIVFNKSVENSVEISSSVLYYII
jgi:hypothetical protein